MWSVLGILWGILAFFGIGVFIALFMGAGLGSSEHSRKQTLLVGAKFWRK